MAMFRVPIPGLVAFAEEKTRAEVAAMLYVAEHTTIRVPRVYHWGTAADNPTGLDLPFMIIEYIPHAHNMYSLMTEPALVQRPELKGDADLVKQHLFCQLANIHIQLSQLRSPTLSALDIVDGRSVVHGTPKHYLLNKQVTLYHVPEAVFAPVITGSKTFSTARQWHVFTADTYIAELLYDHNPDRDADEIRSKFVARYLFRQLALTREPPLHPDSDATPTEDTTKESFRLWGDDLRPHNILCNKYGDVLGVIDWEFVYFAPESFVYDPPYWLIMDRDLKEDILNGGQADGSIEEQQDLTNEKGKCNDIGLQGKHKSVADADDGTAKSDQPILDEDVVHNRKIFMRVLQLEERELYKLERRRSSLNKRDSESHLHQCEGVAEQVAALSIQDDNTTIPTPLYDSMTQRWEKQIGEWLWNFTYRFYRDEFDEWYWDELDEEHDEKHDGEAGEHGGKARRKGRRNYRERLDLLPQRVKDLMELFVARRTEEREQWNPAELMEAVLGQMDGTGPFVTAVVDQVSSS